MEMGREKRRWIMNMWEDRVTMRVDSLVYDGLWALSLLMTGWYTRRMMIKLCM